MFAYYGRMKGGIVTHTSTPPVIILNILQVSFTGHDPIVVGWDDVNGMAGPEYTILAR